MAEIQELRRMKALAQEFRESRAKKANQSTRVSKPFSIAGIWEPNSAPQRQFVESTCREVLYGGAAGGGKSAAATALPVSWAHLPGFLALILRRDSTQLPDLLSKAEALYPKILNCRASAPKKWGGRTAYQVPGGGTILYGHCQLARSYTQFDGWEINLLEFEELTHFTEKQYKYICARVRSSDPKLPTLIRATTNPGGEGHEWVFKHWGAWLDPDFEAEGLPPKDSRPVGPPAKPGEVWWIEQRQEGTATREVYHREDQTPRGTRTLSRTFIPAKLTDNVDLFKNDPNYLEQLKSLDPLRRSQLLGGDWLAKPAAGLFFKRKWCQLVEKSDVPPGARLVRFWDRAATEKTDENDPDFTVGLLMARHGSTYWIVDRKKGQWSPGKVETLMRETVEHDVIEYGKQVEVAFAQDPGQAGKDQAQRMVRILNGFRVAVTKESGSKLVRFGPFSSQAEHGNVRVCRGVWNNDYFACLEDFDGQEKQHDDDADASSGAFTRLTHSNGYSSATAESAGR
jgi:predicted phage terminase large subunit-like protein